VAIDTGKYIFKFTPVSTLFTVSPVSRTVNHTDYNNTDVANFALKPVGVVYDADVVLINTFMTRLGRGNGYVVSCSNKGNQPLNNAQLKLKLDDRLSVQTASEAYALNGDTLIWNISNLQPGERVSITVDFMAAVPPELNPGETVVSCAWVYVPGGDVNLLDNTWCLLDEIRAAYDPNDKTASAEDIDLSAIARREPLAYTIRFENLGNDTAFTVVIKDTLPDNVDFSSLQPVASSHPYTLEVVNGKYLTFTFNNILLPDKSTDSVHSHGFVAYQVVPLSGFSPGNYEIKNTAHIYFDYNLPVTTNTATTRVQIITAIQNNPALAQYIHLYPNPTQDQLVVDIQKLNGEKVQLKLFDLSGKLVQAQFTSQSLTTIDVSRLPAGEYVLQVQTTAGMVAGKVIIAH
jgi:uncharacterized repeat protein (TIGR01451 family)